MSSPIRTLLTAPEAISEVQAANLQNIYMDVGSAPTSEDMFARELIRVHNGTMVGATLKALGPRHSTLDLNNLPLFADQTAWLLIPFLGLPTSAQIDSTGVYNHVFKLGPTSAPPTQSILFYNGVRWKRMLGAVGATMSITQAKEVAPRLNMSFLGHAATNLTAPTVLLSRAGTGSVANPVCTISGGGLVTGVTAGTGGTQYMVPPACHVIGGAGTGAIVRAVVNGAGSISSYVVVNAGTGYTSAPTVILSGGGGVGVDAVATATVVSGAVTAVAPTFGGAGYATAPGVTFYDGNGSGASATATVAAGAFTGVTGLSGGSGYTGAPVIPSIVAAYDSVSYRHLNGTVNAVLSDIMSYTLNLNNNRAGRWTGRASADVTRFTRGLADNSLESMFDYVEYPNSYKEGFDTESDLPGIWKTTYVNTGAGDISTGGTGDNRYPAFTIEVPDVIIEDAKEPDDGPEAVQTITGQGNYAAASATSVIITLRNAVASYAAS